MDFSLVQKQDLPQVYALYQAAIDDMYARGLDQWLWGRYPSKGLLVDDVAIGQLYRMDVDGVMVAVFAVCVGEPWPEYEDIPWHYGVNPVTLHRLALDPAKGGKGYARAIMDFIRVKGLELGCDSLRVDTYSHNTKALKLFSATTVRTAGYFNMPTHPDRFVCFESPLTDDCPLLPMRMHPAYRYGEMTPWGGDALGRLYGKPIPDPRTGEALEISCIPGLESADDVGETLPAHLAREGEALAGKGHAKPFPLLLKLLAADSNLSVQVHPNDDYALAHEGKLGKTEAWVILHAEEGAQLCYGLKEGVTTAMLAEALHTGGDVEPMLSFLPVTPGDVLYMPSGMVHAICGGVTLYEIQQSSDVTYRLWDYHRKNAQGQERPLHIQQSLDVVDPALRGLRTRLPEQKENGEHTVLSVPAFTLSCLNVNGTQTLPPCEYSFRMLTALAPLTLRWEGGKLALAAGESALLAAQSPQIEVDGNGQALISSAS